MTGFLDRGDVPPGRPDGSAEPPARPRLLRYGVAVLSVALAVAARTLVAPLFGDRQPFPTFYVALIVTAGYGGRGPVLLAVGLGFLAANWFFIPPYFAFSDQDVAGALAFFLVGLAIAAYSDVMRAAHERERASAARAIREQAELAHEVAERRRAEAEREAILGQLETARGRLEAVLHQMPAGVIIAEAPTGRFVLANEQVQEIWRHPFIAAGDFHAYRLYKGFHADGRPYQSHEWPVARSLAMGEVVNDEELEYLRGDGSHGTLCVSSAPIRDAGGSIVAAVVVFYDVTARKRADQELRRAHEGLERRVAERTEELAQANSALRAEVAERRLAEQARGDLLRRLVTAQEEERARIARELHDQMGQQLAALNLGLEALAAPYDGGPPAVGGLPRLLDLTRRIGHDMHRIAWELGPAALDVLDLPTALSNYAEEWSEGARVPVRFERTGAWDGRLPPQVETTLYRVVQEALTNVLKHARAGRVSLILERRDGQLTAIVEDDGVGFVAESDAGPGPARGLGLSGMRQRVAAVGGTLQVESEPGAGTTLFVRIPVAALPAGEATR